MEKKTKPRQTRKSTRLKLNTSLPKVTRGEGAADLYSFPVPHYSPSSMVKFSENPFMYKVTYMSRLHIDTAKNVSAVLGTAFHKAMEVRYGGNDMHVISNEEDALKASLQVGMEFLEQYNDGWINYSERIPTKAKAAELLAFMVQKYYEEQPYDEGTVATEDAVKEHVRVEWRGEVLDMPVPIKCYIDRVYRDSKGRLCLKDYKTVDKFSDGSKISGEKIIQAVSNWLAAYAKYGEAPYSFVFEEVKYTQNKDKGPQVRSYEIVMGDKKNELMFDFFFRFYTDLTDALNGKAVFVPNVRTFFDNEVSIIAYIQRLDVPEEVARLQKKNRVTNITDLLNAELQKAGRMRDLMREMGGELLLAKTIDYTKMETHEKIRTKLMEHGVLLKWEGTTEGASVNLYKFAPSMGIKMTKLGSFVDDIEQVTGKTGVRILAPIPNSTLVGVEVPKEVRTFPSLPTPSGKALDIAVGVDCMGNVRRFDLRTAPHLLVAGATRSGKSVFLHNVIRQLKAVRGVDLYLFDPKQVEFAEYEGTTNVVEYNSNRPTIADSLEKLTVEMERRYGLLKELGLRDIEGSGLPYIVVVIDEYADLVLAKRVGHAVQVLAQKGRAAGIHVVVATQRASTKVIDGDIKVNFTTRAVFKMAKKVDSMVMLDEEGAERLLGMGDMLFTDGSATERLQGFNI